MERVRGKLGDRIYNIINELKLAHKEQLLSNNIDRHRNWIKLFLTEYYDPMYKHSLKKSNRNIIYSGNSSEVIEYIEKLEEKTIFNNYIGN